MQTLHRVPVKTLMLVLSGVLALTGFYLYRANLVSQPEAPRNSVPVVSSQSVIEPPATKEDWLTAVNAERQRAGVPVLKLDPRLNASAQRKADEMVAEGLDDTPHENAQGLHGYTYALEDAHCSYASENLLWGSHTKTISAGLHWWLESPPHRAAILDSQYQTTGFGISGIFVVEHFCRS